MYHSSLTPLLIQTRSEHVYKDHTIKRDSHLSKELRESKLVSRHGIPVDCVCMLSQVQLCHPMDCSLPASFVYGITQARILEWVAISSFRGSSWPRDQTHLSCVSCIADIFFTCWAIREACYYWKTICLLIITQWPMTDSVKRAHFSSMHDF